MSSIVKDPVRDPALINHLKRHPIEINKKVLADEVPSQSSKVSSPKKRCLQPSIVGFIKKDSLKKLLARCAARLLDHTQSKNLLPKEATRCQKARFQ